MISLNLQCGRSVYISGFHYFRTYEELIGGAPDEELNSRIMERALTRMETIWGERKTHLIPPTIEMVQSKHPLLPSQVQHPYLPSAELTAWITCKEPVDPNYMASELVLVWYLAEEAFELSSLREVTSNALKTIQWNELADDFNW